MSVALPVGAVTTTAAAEPAYDDVSADNSDDDASTMTATTPCVAQYKQLSRRELDALLALRPDLLAHVQRRYGGLTTPRDCGSGGGGGDDSATHSTSNSSAGTPTSSPVRSSSSSSSSSCSNNQLPHSTTASVSCAPPPASSTTTTTTTTTAAATATTTASRSACCSSTSSSSSTDKTASTDKPSANASNERARVRVRRSNSMSEKQRVLAHSYKGFSVISDLLSGLLEELDVNAVIERILKSTGAIVDSAKASLFLYDERHNMLETTFWDNEVATQKKFRVPVNGKTIAGFVAMTQTALNITDVYNDPRFDPSFDEREQFRTKAMLAIPLCDHRGVLGVVELINKVSDDAFSEQDMNLAQTFLKVAAAALRNARLHEQLESSRAKTELFLRMARSVSGGTGDLASVARQIVEVTKDALQAEVASLFVVDRDESVLIPCIFEKSRRPSKDIRLPMSKGIAGHVASTGETLNIANAYDDERFNPAVDRETGFVTRGILCQPIFDDANQVVGVSQLLNKRTSPTASFTDDDVELFRGFQVFCGISMQKALLLKRVKEAHAKLLVTIEKLTYHSLPSATEVAALADAAASAAADAVASDALQQRITSFAFDPHQLSDADVDGSMLLCMLYRMFDTLGLVDALKIASRAMWTFLLTVRRNYRSVTYHNFVHASAVAHQMFLMLHTCDERMRSVFADEERFALMIAALCHDLDHRGQNNTFQKRTDHPLAQLYSTSILEHHHLDQTLWIISASGVDICSTLAESRYRAALRVIEDAILATDLANYFAQLPTWRRLLPPPAEATTTNTTTTNATTTPAIAFEPHANAEHKNVLIGMLMTCADLNAQTKPWTTALHIGKSLSEEFYEQGDVERSMGVEPLAFMDRRCARDLGASQADFIKNVALPVFELAERFDARLACMRAALLDNLERWRGYTPSSDELAAIEAAGARYAEKIALLAEARKIKQRQSDGGDGGDSTADAATKKTD